MVIINANVRTMTEKNYPNGYISVRQGKILAVGPMEDCPQDAQLFDAQGMQALPGLIDAHCHIGMWENGMGFEGDDGNENSDPCTPQLRAIDAINPFDRAFAEALDAGVTTVVSGPGSSNPIAGQVCAMKTNGCRVDSMLIRAPLAIKFALGENPKNSYHEKEQGPVTRMGIAAAIREQLAKAQRYAKELEEAGADEELSPPDYDAKCEALLPLLRREIPAHFHAHRTDDIFTAIRIAKEFSIDYLLIHATEGHLVADELACERARVILGPLIGARTKPELAGATTESAAILHRAGVEVAISTDHPEIPCNYLQMSAQLAAQAGMDEIAALEAITCKAAHICGISDRVGTLEVGKDADVLLFSQDPMHSWEKPAVVFIDGKQVRG